MSDNDPWAAGFNIGYSRTGAHKRPWFLTRRTGGVQEWLFDARGYLVRFASHEAASKRADILNKEEG